MNVVLDQNQIIIKFSNNHTLKDKQRIMALLTTEVCTPQPHQDDPPSMMEDVNESRRNMLPQSFLNPVPITADPNISTNQPHFRDANEAFLSGMFPIEDETCLTVSKNYKVPPIDWFNDETRIYGKRPAPLEFAEESDLRNNEIIHNINSQIDSGQPITYDELMSNEVKRLKTERDDEAKYLKVKYMKTSDMT